MRRALLLLLPLSLPMLVGACGGLSPTRQASCEDLVNSDPEVRDLTLKYAGSAGSSPNQASMFDPAPVRRAKMKACLQGYPIDGGVEPVRHPNYTFDLF